VDAVFGLECFEWKSATAKTKLRMIDSHLCDLKVVMDDIGPPVDLIGASACL